METNATTKTLAEVRAMAQEVARKAQSYFQQISCYEHCSEAMKLREYAGRTDDAGKIAERTLRLLKGIEAVSKSPIAQARAGADKGKLVFSGIDRYKAFFGKIA